MNKPAFVFFLGTACCLAGPSNAQPLTPPAPPVPSLESSTSSDEAGIDLLTTKYKISKTEAAERLRLEQKVGELVNRMRASDPTTFGGMFVDHEPTYKIVLLFTDADTRTSHAKKLLLT